MILTNDYQYIGRTGGVGCDSGWNYYVLLYAKTLGDTSTGKHRVSVKMRLACSHNSTFYGYRTDGSVTVDGVSAISWSNTQIPEVGAQWQSNLTEDGVTYSRWVDLKEGSVQIDTKFLAKNITVAASWSRRSIVEDRPSWLPYTTAITANISVTLPMIARPSTISVSADRITMGQQVRINITRQSAAFKHDLYYSFANSAYVLFASNVDTEFPWTVPDLVSKIPGQSSAVAVLRCVTRNAAVTVGEEKIYPTLHVPGVAEISFSADEVKMGETVTVNTNRNSTGYTHTLTYNFGGKTGEIARNVTDACLWQVSDLAAWTGNNLWGQGTVVCTCYNGGLKIGQTTKPITLKVPDATVPGISVKSVDIGDDILISLPRKAESFVHRLTYVLSEGSTEKASGSIDGIHGTSCQWTVPPELDARLEGVSGKITVCCETYLSDQETKVGTEYITFDVTVSHAEAFLPKINALQVSPDNSSFSFFFDEDVINTVYLAGMSKVNIVIDAQSPYDAQIVSYETRIDGQVLEGNNVTTPKVLATTGNIALTCTVTDRKGRSKSETQTIFVDPYRPPRPIPPDGADKILFYRCDESGNRSHKGKYLYVSVKRDYDKAPGGLKNKCALALSIGRHYRTLLAMDSEDTLDTFTGIVEKDDFDVPIELDITKVYQLRISVMDLAWSTDAVYLIVPSAFATWNVPLGGHGITLGGYHDTSKYDVFDCLFNAEFEGDVYGRVAGLGALPAVEGNSEEPGVYAVADASVFGLEAGPGVLKVWNSDGLTDDKTLYRIQEFIRADNTGEYRRSIYRTTAEGDWLRGDWVNR